MVYRLNEEKEIRIPDEDIERLVNTMDIDKDEAVEIWLEDEGYLINEEQEELCRLAKENKSIKIITAKSSKKTPKKKTQKERVRKPNPTKEMIIAKIAEILPTFATDVIIENKGKIITFKVGNDDFKIDLVQKRKPKEDK